MTLDVKFIPNGRTAKCPPDPIYPDGVVVDVSDGRPACETKQPYPAASCGLWVVRCHDCDNSIAITAAGRRDDPSLVRIACKRKGHRTVEPCRRHHHARAKAVQVEGQQQPVNCASLCNCATIRRPG